MKAAFKSLKATQHPSDCSSTRLLVYENDPSYFEGLGSILVNIAEALAEAHAAKRTLILGPNPAEPSVLRGAQCEGSQGWHCFFQPVSKCDWSAVSSIEAKDLFLATDSCTSRIKLSTGVRGGPTMYSPPPDLLSLLPTDAEPELASQCWAAAVFGSISKLQKNVKKDLELLRTSLFGVEPYLAAHMRVGDTALTALEYGGRVYTNKPIMNATILGKALRQFSNISQNLYLATDYHEADAAAEEIAVVSGIPNTKLLHRFRTPHGSHNTAFAISLINEVVLIPFELWGSYMGQNGRYSGPSAHRKAESDQNTVRMEALQDLYLLANAKLIAGTAASHFRYVQSRAIDKDNVSVLLLGYGHFPFSRRNMIRFGSI
jgi:hypothetical protein